MICSPMFCFWIFSLSRILIATRSFVSVFTAYLTFCGARRPGHVSRQALGCWGQHWEHHTGCRCCLRSGTHRAASGAPQPQGVRLGRRPEGPLLCAECSPRRCLRRESCRSHTSPLSSPWCIDPPVSLRDAPGRVEAPTLAPSRLLGRQSCASRIRNSGRRFRTRASLRLYAAAGKPRHSEIW